MPETTYWRDSVTREAFMAQGRAVWEQLRGQLQGQCGVVAIEPRSGAYYVGETLGKASRAAYLQHPDQWLYFVRTDDPTAEIILPTW